MNSESSLNKESEECGKSEENIKDTNENKKDIHTPEVCIKRANKGQRGSLKKVDNKSPGRKGKQKKLTRRSSFDIEDDTGDGDFTAQISKAISKVLASDVDIQDDKLLCEDEMDKTSNVDDTEMGESKEEIEKDKADAKMSDTNEEVVTDKAEKEEGREDDTENVDKTSESDQCPSDEKIITGADIIDLTGEDLPTGMNTGPVPLVSKEVKKYANVSHEEKDGKKLMRISFSKVKQSNEEEERITIKTKDAKATESEENISGMNDNVTKGKKNKNLIDGSERNIELNESEQESGEVKTTDTSLVDEEVGAKKSDESKDNIGQKTGEKAPILIEGDGSEDWLSSSKKLSAEDKKVIVVGSQDDDKKQTVADADDVQEDLESSNSITKDKDTNVNENKENKESTKDITVNDKSEQKDKEDVTVLEKEENRKFTEKELEEKKEVARQAMGFVCETDSDSDSDDSTGPKTLEAKDLYDDYIELSSGVSDTEGNDGDKDKADGDSIGARSDDSRSDGSLHHARHSSRSRTEERSDWLSTRPQVSTYRPESPTMSSDDELVTRPKNAKDQTKKVRNRDGEGDYTYSTKRRRRSDRDDIFIGEDSNSRESSSGSKNPRLFRKFGSSATKQFRKRGDEESSSANYRPPMSQERYKRRQPVVVPSASEFLQSGDKKPRKYTRFDSDSKRYEDSNSKRYEDRDSKRYDEHYRRDDDQRYESRDRYDRHRNYDDKRSRDSDRSRPSSYYKRPIKAEGGGYVSNQQAQTVTCSQFPIKPPTVGTSFTSTPPPFLPYTAPPPGFMPPFPPPGVAAAASLFAAQQAATQYGMSTFPTTATPVTTQSTTSSMAQLKANIFQITGLTMNAAKTTTVTTAPAAESSVTVTPAPLKQAPLPPELQTAKAILSESATSSQGKPEDLSNLVSKLKQVTQLLESVTETQSGDTEKKTAPLPDERYGREKNTAPLPDERYGRDYYDDRRRGSLREDERQRRDYPPDDWEDRWHRDDRRRPPRSRYDDPYDNCPPPPSRLDPHYEEWRRFEEERYERDRYYDRLERHPDPYNRYRDEYYRRREDPYERYPEHDPYWDDHPRPRDRYMDRYDHPRDHPRDYPREGYRDHPDDHPRYYPREGFSDHPEEYVRDNEPDHFQRGGGFPGRRGAFRGRGGFNPGSQRGGRQGPPSVGLKNQQIRPLIDIEPKVKQIRPLIDPKTLLSLQPKVTSSSRLNTLLCTSVVKNKPMKTTTVSRTGKIMSVTNEKVNTDTCSNPQQNQQQDDKTESETPVFLTGLLQKKPQ